MSSIDRHGWEVTAIKFRGVHDIADELGVDVQTVRRWIHSGRLRAFKPGKEYRIQESDLEEFLRAREVRPKVDARSSLEPTFNHVLEEERRKDKYLPWLEFAERYNERWHEKAHRGGLTRGEVLECRETLRNLAPTIGRLRKEEERGLSPERREEMEDELIMWRVASLLMGAFEQALRANKKLFDESEITQFKRERLEDLGKAANG